jgi:hypothetical protein
MLIRSIHYSLSQNDWRDFYFDILDKADEEILMSILKKYEYQLVEFWDGYAIKHQSYDNKWSSYLAKIKKDGTYEFCHDHSYAKTFKSKKIAEKHLQAIRERELK